MSLFTSMPKWPAKIPVKNTKVMPKDIPNIFNDGINVESAKIGSDGICCDVFERGSGTTFSCGSGAVSTAFAAKKLFGFNLKKYPIFMRGGTLFVEFDNEKAYLSSEVTPVFTGETI